MMTFREFKLGTQVYRVRKEYILSAIILLLAVSIVTLWVYGFDKTEKLYIHCPSSSITFCENPLYNNPDYCGKTIDPSIPICKDKLLPQGFVYGSPPPFIVKHFLEISLATLILAFIINHFKYNKDFKFKKVKDEGVFDEDSENKEQDKPGN